MGGELLGIAYRLGPGPGGLFDERNASVMQLSIGEKRLSEGSQPGGDHEPNRVHFPGQMRFISAVYSPEPATVNLTPQTNALIRVTPCTDRVLSMNRTSPYRSDQR